MIAGLALVLFAAAQTAQPQVTFTNDVAPILQRHCQVCHRPGSDAAESAPHPL